jgi:hypothetical protein
MDLEHALNCIGLDDNKYKFCSGKVRLKAKLKNI